MIVLLLSVCLIGLDDRSVPDGLRVRVRDARIYVSFAHTVTTRDVVESQVKWITSRSSIGELNLRNSLLTKDDLKCILTSVPVRRLMLRECPLAVRTTCRSDDSLLDVIALAKGLEVLELEHSTICQDDLSPLKACEHLTVLALGHWDWNVHVDSNSLRAIKSLRRLTIVGKSISDKQLTALFGVSQLKDLSLHILAVPDDSYARLVRALPYTVIGVSTSPDPFYQPYRQRR